MPDTIKYKISLICAVCCLPPVLSGCGSRQNAATEPTIITVNYNGLQDKGTVNLSELFEEPEFIALDSRSTDAYVSDQTNAISDNYIGRSGGYFKSIPYKLYDRKTGEYLGPVGNIGRGPGEYAYILSSYIDEQNGRIWLHYAPEKLYVYDLKTREFIEDVPLAYGLGDYNFYKSDFIVHPESGTITCVRVPYPEDMDTVIAWQQDFKGNVLWAASEKGRSMPSTQSEGISTWLLTSHKNVSNGIDASFNTLNAVEDTVFIAVNGRMNPVFTIDLGRKAGTQEKVNMTTTSTLLPDKILTSINHPNPAENGIITFSPSGTVITDIKSGEAYRCVIVNDYLGTGEISPSPSYGYLIHSYDPVSFRETATAALENGSLSDAAKDKIRTILSDLSDDDNNILVLYKIK